MQIESKTMMTWSSRKNKSAFFIMFILSEGSFFHICVLLQCIVYWISFRIFIRLHVKKCYFIYFCCLFLKSSKAFSVSLTWMIGAHKIHPLIGGLLPQLVSNPHLLIFCLLSSWITNACYYILLTRISKTVLQAPLK